MNEIANLMLVSCSQESSRKHWRVCQSGLLTQRRW